MPHLTKRRPCFLSCALILTLGVGATPLYAAKNDELPEPWLRLLCDWTKVFDVESSRTEATSGESTLIVYRVGTDVVIDAHGMTINRVFSGDLTEAQIAGKGEVTDPMGKAIIEHLKVNRYSGKSEMHFFISDALKLIFSGRCEMLKDKKF